MGHKKILLIDNFDSFTYNLVQALGALGAEVEVCRNDEDLQTLKTKSLSHLVISPGPGNPANAGHSAQVIRHFMGDVPILGVCLGMQILGDIYGVPVIRAPEPVHGRIDWIRHDGRGVFRKLSSPTKMARYHSLVLDQRYLPPEVEASAYSSEGLLMGLRLREFPKVEAVQFHPESFMSEEGELLLRNFLYG